MKFISLRRLNICCAVCSSPTLKFCMLQFLQEVVDIYIFTVLPALNCFTRAERASRSKAEASLCDIGRSRLACLAIVVTAHST